MKLLASFIVVGLIGLGMGDAEAKRFGMGKSFGSKKMFSMPHKRVDKPAKAQSAPKQSAPAAGAAGKAGAGARSGMGAGLMGGLAGLAMGGLLGALLFGGAFENINFLDILILGLLAFLLYKVFSGRRTTTPEPAAPAGYGSAELGPDDSGGQGTPGQAVQRRRFDTDLLFGNKARASDSGITAGLEIPADFDAEHFLEGAKTLFARMQKAWDEGDLGDIRQFTTDKVFAEVQEQLWNRSGDSRTLIHRLDAHLHQVRELDDELEASVVFEAELEENGQPVKVSELWHFTKPRHSAQPTWYLDGIQQIED